MKTEKKSDVTKTAPGASSISNFFHERSAECREEIYRLVANAAVLEQKEIIQTARDSKLKTTFNASQKG